MSDDPVADLRRWFPTSVAMTGASEEGPVVPFAARFAVPVRQAKHSRPPTRTTSCMPTQSGGDGAGQGPRPDDTVVPAND